MASNELHRLEESGAPQSDSPGGEARGGSYDVRHAPELSDRSHAGPDRRPVERTSAEPRGREEYGDSIRSLGPPIPASNDSRYDITHNRARETPALGANDSSIDGERPPGRDVTGGEYQSEGESGTATEDSIYSGSPDQPSDPGCITHYHGAFKGQALDLYTDGVRWAPGNREEGEDIVGQKPDRSPGDTGDQPPSGNELLETVTDDVSRADRFRRELYRHSDELQDAIEKNSNLVHDVFARPPASGHEVSPVNTPYVSQPPQYSVDAGAMATAALALGILLDRGVRQLPRHQADRREEE